jgi:hypothetical protein
MCSRNPSLPKRIARAGAVDLLVTSLKTHMAHAGVVHGVVYAIRAMVAKSREVVLQFIVERLPLVLHSALSHHMQALPQSDKLVILICAVLNHCGYKTAAHKNEIGAAGLIEQLRDLVSIASAKEDLAVLHPALATLCTLISCPDNQDRFQEVGGVEVALEILERWRAREDIVAVACELLRHACSDHDNNRDDFKAINGTRKLQSVLQTYKNDPNVVTAACHALAVICHSDPELRTSAGMLDTIPCAVAAMDTFPDNASLQAGACSFLFSITQGNPRNKARVVRHGGRASIVRALKRHPRNDDISSFGGHALLQVQDIPVADTVSVEGSAVESDVESETPGSRRRLRLIPRRRSLSRDNRLLYSNMSPDAMTPPASPMDAAGPMPIESLTAPASPEEHHRRKVRRRKLREDAEAPEMHQLHGGSFQQPDRGEATPLGPPPPDANSRQTMGGGWFRRRSQRSNQSNESLGSQSADSQRRSVGSGFAGSFGFRRRSVSSRNEASASNEEEKTARADRVKGRRGRPSRHRGREAAVTANDGDEGHAPAAHREENDIGNMDDLDGLLDGFEGDDAGIERDDLGGELVSARLPQFANE